MKLSAMDDVQAKTLRTAARYLGIKQPPGFSDSFSDLDPSMEQLLTEAYADMRSFAEPRHHLQRGAVRIEHSPEGSASAPWLSFGSMPPVQSRDLCSLFEGCEEGFALLATLGMKLDLRIRRLLATSPALAVAVGACGSAYIDQYIDEVLEAAQEKENLFFTRRFSPGYGDAPLSMQPTVLRFLSATRLGVHCTSGFLMVPEKSVTALLGITAAADAMACKETPAINRNGCAACEKRDCPLRNET